MRRIFNFLVGIFIRRKTSSSLFSNALQEGIKDAARELGGKGFVSKSWD